MLISSHGIRAIHDETVRSPLTGQDASELIYGQTNGDTGRGTLY